MIRNYLVAFLPNNRLDFVLTLRHRHTPWEGIFLGYSDKVIPNRNHERIAKIYSNFEFSVLYVCNFKKTHKILILGAHK